METRSWHAATHQDRAQQDQTGGEAVAFDGHLHTAEAGSGSDRCSLRGVLAATLPTAVPTSNSCFMPGQLRMRRCMDSMTLREVRASVIRVLCPSAAGRNDDVVLAWSAAGWLLGLSYG